MARSDGLIHHKMPPGSAIHTRQPVPAHTPDAEQESQSYEQHGLDMLREQFRTVARLLDNRAAPVDEYNSAAITGAGSSVALTVQPTYEYMPELIESIIVTGPAGSITLVLGDRIWALTIPASGLLVIGPLRLMLGRSDTRSLTSGTPGTYTLELMGRGDRRFKI